MSTVSAAALALAQPAVPPRPEQRARVGDLVLVSSSATDIGLVRADNQDRTLHGSRFFAVMDGMGGLKAGDVAAALCRDRLAAALPAMRTEPGPALEGLVEAVKGANAAVYREACGRKVLMGCTCTALLASPGGTGLLAHVGDSRAYRLRAGRLRQLTADHNAIETQPDGSFVVRRDMLTRAVGTDSHVDVDRYAVELAPGDVLLLCTDGLHGVVSDAVIQMTIAAYPPGQAVAELIAIALAAGGPDNISAVVARVEAAEGA